MVVIVIHIIARSSFNVHVLIQFRFFFGLKIQPIMRIAYILLPNFLYCKLEQNRNIMKLILPFHINKVGAGFPSPATDYVEDDIDLNTHLIKIYHPHFLLGFMENPWIKLGFIMVIFW